MFEFVRTAEICPISSFSAANSLVKSTVIIIKAVKPKTNKKFWVLVFDL